jgi:anti-sigma factor RsiW
MRCKAVRKQLSRYVDLEVPPELREEIEAHLAGCPDCRQALAKLEQVAGVLASGSLPPVPEGFAERVMGKARAQARREPQARWSDWRPLGWWWDAAPAMRAAAIVAALVGLTAGAVMSGGFARPSSFSRGQQAAAGGTGSTVQTSDFLGGVPAGSVEQTYLAWMAETSGK